MKMISSTRSTSIIGVTLMSDWTPPELPVLIAMSLLLLILVRLEQPALVGLGDGCHHPDTGPTGRLYGLLHFGVFQLVVGLEVQDLVFRPGLEDAAQLVSQRPLRQRPSVEEVAAGLVDT